MEPLWPLIVRNQRASLSPRLSTTCSAVDTMASCSTAASGLLTPICSLQDGRISFGRPHMLPLQLFVADAVGEVLRKLEEIEKQLAQPKQVGGKVQISAVGLSEMEHIQTVGKVKIVPYEGKRLSYTPRKQPWKAFEWDDSKTERGQSAQYLEHLKKYIDVESSDNMFTDVARKADFLSYTAFDREFVGTADVAIAAKSAVLSGLTGSGLKCIIVLKKHLGSGTSDTSFQRASFQTIVALLMATKKYPDSDTVAFLTDLREYWQIFWDDGRTIFYHCFDTSDNAVGYLEHFLDVGHNIRANPRKEFDADQLSGLDVLWGPKRQKLLTRIEEHPAGDRLSELDGLLTPEEESYFDAQRTILAVRSLPIFWDLPREALKFEFRGTGSEPPPSMYT
ncbi:hypothetical protein KC19_8G145200 [Ceratodon purpureus]|uniref:Uncharacterized protein n=1 Tax=Ceratodon purpureus TaxID=3225 RepID=A0A8T0H3D6_CERPU|nr:hypothetical protein KC19_8G145200 [Ceratodon purpureus]